MEKNEFYGLTAERQYKTIRDKTEQNRHITVHRSSLCRSISYFFALFLCRYPQLLYKIRFSPRLDYGFGEMLSVPNVFNEPQNFDRNQEIEYQELLKHIYFSFIVKIP